MTDLRREPKLFGSPRRTQLLLLLSLLEESYPGELVRLLGLTKASVAYMLDDLEAEGVIASRHLGRTRRITLDPAYFGAQELRLLLLKLAEGDRAVQAIAGSRRASPRRKGKNA